MPVFELIAQTVHKLFYTLTPGIQLNGALLQAGPYLPAPLRVERVRFSRGCSAFLRRVRSDQNQGTQSNTIKKQQDASK